MTKQNKLETIIKKEKIKGIELINIRCVQYAIDEIKTLDSVQFAFDKYNKYIKGPKTNYSFKASSEIKNLIIDYIKTKL